MLNLMLANTEEIVKEVKIGNTLSSSKHTFVESIILRNVGLAKSRVKSLSLRRWNFHLFKELLVGISGKALLRDKKWNKSDRRLSDAQELFYEVQQGQVKGVVSGYDSMRAALSTRNWGFGWTKCLT